VDRDAVVDGEIRAERPMGLENRPTAGFAYCAPRDGAMLLIPCPWCGPRDEVEFRYGGQAHVDYPKDPDALTDDAWADYLFMRDNPKGVFRERWVHAAGCRRWFNAERDTVTHAIARTYPSEIEAGGAPRAAGTKAARR
jgi:heterotetrameric sarcosine oxidase delta subunit